MIINRFSFILLLSSLLTLNCSSSKSLSDAEKAKLDLPLLRLLTDEPGEKNRLDFLLRPDGTKEYTLIVQSEHPEALRELGINVSSVFGNVVVVHVTLDELKKIVSLPTVRSIKTESKRTIQPHK